ncbi:MFS transporter [Actinoplanes sp. LDG1-06]|uniref:MFS transporter n=1 Tax=Paractinoplanes ovalisporus TaxID=2810368 RepID=A0ABS2A9C7_9ACTN|nr:MFS transporter [Actinoplanes ovalisporus]MBM2616438.1 MFS transporter [Actinoplanes ovalisporus]
MTAAPEVLREPGFRRLWLANAFRDSAGQVSSFALPVTAVTLLHASAFQMSLIVVFSRVGFVLIGLPAGVWIDRWVKRDVLMWADIAYFVSLATIPIAYVAGVLTVPQLIAVALVMSVANVFFSIAHTSILPLILPKRRVADARARLQTSESAIQASSPGVAGVLTTVVAAPLLYAASTIFHLVSAVLIRSVDAHEKPKSRDEIEGRDFRREVREGVAVTFRQPLLRLLVGQVAFHNFGIGLMASVVAVFILRTLGISPWLFGVLSTVGAVAGLVASVACPPLRRRLGEVRMTLIFSGFAPFAVLCIPLAGVHHGLAVAFIAVAEVVLSFAGVGRSVAAAGLRARVTPNRYLSRVSAASGVITQGATPLGALLGGLLATSVGVTNVLWLSVAVIAVPLVLMLRSPIRSHRRLPPEWEVED